MLYREVRRLVIVICPDAYKTHKLVDGLPPIRYLILLDQHSNALWVDDPTWRIFRRMSASMEWAEASIVTAPCEGCKFIESN